MVISLPAEGFNNLGDEGENLAEECKRLWGEDFSINPRTYPGKIPPDHHLSEERDSSELSYANALRSMTPEILLDIVNEIRRDRNVASG